MDGINSLVGALLPLIDAMLTEGVKCVFVLVTIWVGEDVEMLEAANETKGGQSRECAYLWAY